MIVKDFLKLRLVSVVSWLRSSEVAMGFILAVIIGVISGFGAIAFRWLILNFQSLFFEGGESVLSFLGQYYVIVIPAIGGLLVGPLVYFFAREARGHGVPEVMESVAVKGGRIRPRVAFIKALASSLCIGSGGSVGREGPIVQIGASAGSSIGQWFKLPTDTLKTLVACGAAGGISATFNAPIAGVFFALEVILGRVVTPRFAYIVISSVVADFLAQAFLGNQRAFIIPEFGMVSNWEIGFYVVLGIFAGLFALAFITLLYRCEELFDAFKFPEYLKPVLGGLIVGLIGLYSHDLFGVGYEGIERALSGQVVLQTLLILLVLKVVATSVTLGSGGSGGVFAPSLFIGAMLGAAVGTAFGHVFPDITGPVGAYGIVGMAAVFSAAARAPFSATLIVYEMTGDYAIILPLLVAVAVSTALSRSLKRENIYTIKLLRRGVDIRRGEMADVMRDITVAEAMTRDFPTVPAEMPVKELIKLFRKSEHHGFPVLDAEGRLSGIVTLTDVEHYLERENAGLTAGDIATQSPFVVYPDQSLHHVLSGSEQEYGRIPVVSRDDRRRLLGVLRRYDIINAYRRRVSRRKRASRARK